MLEKIFNKKSLYFIVLANFTGTLFGFYYYIDQLISSPLALWIFIPASPIATFFMATSILSHIKSSGSKFLDALAFISNFKYGFWTVFALWYYSDIFFTGNTVFLYSFMVFSHFAMFLQSFIVFKWQNIDLKSLITVFLWYLFNDIIDYTLGTYTELYTDHIFPAEAAAYTLTFAAFISGLTLIQKDDLLNKVRELRKI